MSEKITPRTVERNFPADLGKTSGKTGKKINRALKRSDAIRNGINRDVVKILGHLNTLERDGGNTLQTNQKLVLELDTSKNGIEFIEKNTLRAILTLLVLFATLTITDRSISGRQLGLDVADLARKHFLTNRFFHATPLSAKRTLRATSIRNSASIKGVSSLSFCVQRCVPLRPP